MAAAALREAGDQACPVEVVEVEEGKAKVNEEECLDGGTCLEDFPEGTLSPG